MFVYFKSLFIDHKKVYTYKKYEHEYFFHDFWEMKKFVHFRLSVRLEFANKNNFEL